MTGEMYDDLVVIHLPSMEEKAAIVDDPGNPFFDIDHFRNHPGVLVQQSRIGEISREELAEIITEAWAHRAPKHLVKEFFGDG